MNKHKTVMYNGMECTLYDSYLGIDSGPVVRINSPQDTDKAYALGFECVGFPDELVKPVTAEEYEQLVMTGSC
ncbi:hypothetical protein [Ruminococcus sp. NK3A76]|uniref:hypothetical protein n=1 Tax=Ruminococcus sp. NK3A76 TaxID=877411 RepID=UPI00048B7800|nr:hypothetical protein [Ruminococcus sp. NK3A76]